MEKQQSYVLGFLRDLKGRVVLIRKNRPEWQAGFLNGVGGKVEFGEEPFNAMCREFKEETGVSFINWIHFSQLIDGQYIVNVYRGECPDLDELGLATMTSEQVEVHSISELVSNSILPSAHYLALMSMHEPLFTSTLTYR